MNDDHFYAHVAKEQDKKQDIISALKKILNYLEKEEITEADDRPEETGKSWIKKTYENN